jgi:hypothetical protein
MRKNIDVDNNVVYQSIKFELKIPYILGSIKMTKSDTFWILSTTVDRCQNLSFLYSPKHKILS